MSEINVENLLEACERNLKSASSDVRFSAVISLKEIGESAIPLLLTATKDRDAKVSEAASQALGEIGGVGISALRDLLYTEIRAKRKLGNRFVFRCLIFVLCMFAIAYLGNLFFDSQIARTTLHFVVQIISSGFMGLVIFDKVYIRRGAITALENTDDIKFIGLFALFLNDKDNEIRSVAKKVLIRLLPKARASDAQYINKDEMQAIIDTLRKQKQDAGFMLALLRGLEQIGDERALANVAALTDDSSVSPSVKLAARECLPYLQIRAEQAKQAQTLLRASSGNETAPETLLRPAQGVAPNDERQLLRPKL